MTEQNANIPSPSHQSLVNGIQVLIHLYGNTNKLLFTTNFLTSIPVPHRSPFSFPSLGCIYLWWFKRIIGRELDIKEKHSSFIHRSLRTKNCRVPFIKIVSFGTCTGNKQKCKNQPVYQILTIKLSLRKCFVS